MSETLNDFGEDFVKKCNEMMTIFFISGLECPDVVFYMNEPQMIHALVASSYLNRLRLYSIEDFFKTGELTLFGKFHIKTKEKYIESH